MLTVTIDMYPHGANPAIRIGIIEIVNTGKAKNRPEFGDYEAIIYGEDGQEAVVDVKDFRRADGAFVLLKKVIETAEARGLVGREVIRPSS